MPVWHEATRGWVNQGRLVLLGVTQEQHADRCRLFAQWKRFDWPILHDPINLLEAPAVPIVVAIDEHGIVRAVGPHPETLEADFLDKTFADEASSDAPRSAGRPDAAESREVEPRIIPQVTKARASFLIVLLLVIRGRKGSLDGLRRLDQCFRRVPLAIPFEE